MTSVLPSVIPPTSGDVSPPPAPPTSSSSNSSTTSPSPTSSRPNQTIDPPSSSAPSNSSAPPPQSPPPAVPAAPPPSPPLSPPPALTTPPVSPPPLTPASPPPSPPASPPPSVPTSPPPSSPAAPPPSPVLSPPPPSGGSPPPQAATAPPVATSPPPQVNSHSAPPPANVATPPSSKSPPSPRATPPPESSSSPPTLTPPPSRSKSAPPPSTTSPSTPKLASPPPSVPSTSSPPTISPPATPSTPSTTGSPSSLSPLPSIPTEKPTAESTNGKSASANATSSGKNVLGTGGAVAIGAVVGFIVLSLLVMAVWFALKRKRKRAGPKIGYTMPSPFASSQNSDSVFLRPQSPHQLMGSGSKSGFYSPSEPGGVNNSRSWFTYEELVRATDGFSEHNLLGEGGFGCVYKGILTDGREVAVKQLKIGGGQGEREFRAEVEIISRVHHRHLVSLVGYCISEHQRLLVYDYVPNNTLHYHLHGRGRPVMDWAVRVKVAAGAARGIAYLHEDCHPRIIHRDIKSSNILLDSNFEARVSDFGLAKLALDSNTHARPLLAEAIEHQEFEELVDPRLEKNYVAHEMFRMIEAAAACVRHSAAKRPRMSQVVRALDSLDESSDLTNGMKPGQSEVFDSAQQSAQIRMFQRLAFGSQEYSSSFFNHSQSSWRSQEDGSQGSWRSRDHGNQSSWSREHRERSTLMP
ncbi:hypothetical protein QUC31_017320 [Theobroma cacao]